MYNINIYSYWKEPYTNNKKFSIYPLNDPGKKNIIQINLIIIII